MLSLQRKIFILQHPNIILWLTEQGTVLTILTISQALTLLVTHLRQMNKKHGDFGGTCNHNIDHWYNFNPQLLNTLYVAAISCEMWIYIVLSIKIYKSDRDIRPHITETAYKNRKAKTTIDFVGHLAHFVLEIATLVVEGICFAMSEPLFRVAALLMFTCNSGLINMLLIFMTPTLKKELASSGLCNIVWFQQTSGSGRPLSTGKTVSVNRVFPQPLKAGSKLG